MRSSFPSLVGILTAFLLFNSPAFAGGPDVHFSTNPANITILAGKTANFTVVATGNTPLTYQWQFSQGDTGVYSNLTNGDGISGATTNKLSLTVNQGDTSYDDAAIRCFASDSSGGVSSPKAILTVNHPPFISSQPNGSNAQLGATVNFSMSASGDDPLTYQWKKNKVTIPGATDSMFSVANITANDAGNYTVVVTNPFGTVTSNIAPINIVALPTITKPPTNATVVAGKPATFSVTATSKLKLTYDWFVSTDGGSTYSELHNGSGITGAQSNKLTIATTAGNTTGNGNKYICYVYNGILGLNSPAATLAVGVVPKITVQSANTTVLTDGEAELTVTATGSNLAYQWQFSADGKIWGNMVDGPGVLGSNTSTLQVLAGSTIYFRCVLSNAVGTLTSAKILVAVPAGIYFGTFSGSDGTGKFAAMVQSNGESMFTGYSTTKKKAFLYTNVMLTDNGTFSTPSSSGNGTVDGTFTDTTVTATETKSGAITKTIKGTHKADAGKFTDSAGIYTGSGGTTDLTLVVAADGSFLVYAITDSPGDQGDGGSGTIGANNKFTVTMLTGTKVTGTLDTDTHEINGTFKDTEGNTGSFATTLDIPL